MISREEITTTSVAARPTPFAPSFVLYPRNEEIVPIVNPKTAVFRVGAIEVRPFERSERLREIELER